MAHRFFVATPLVVGQDITLPEPVARQVSRVLRLRPGERIILLDGRGREYPVILTGVTASAVIGRVEPGWENGAEPALAVTLYVALLKGEHFTWTLQKGTEVGAVAFVPLVTARTIVQVQVRDDAAKRERWQRITREAAEQAGRGVVPLVHPVQPFAAACHAAAAAGPALIPWEEERARTLQDALRAAGPCHRLGLFIGPEGGFTLDEVALARDFGIVPVTLGPRILRAETAAVVATALAVANAECGVGNAE